MRTLIFLVLVYAFLGCKEEGPGSAAVPFTKLHVGMPISEVTQLIKNTYTWADTFYKKQSTVIDNIVYQPAHFADINGLFIISYPSTMKLRKAIFVRDDIRASMDVLSRHPDYLATFPKQFINHVDTTITNDVTQEQYDHAVKELSAGLGEPSLNDKGEIIKTRWNKHKESVTARMQARRLTIELKPETE